MLLPHIATLPFANSAADVWYQYRCLGDVSSTYHASSSRWSEFAEPADRDESFDLAARVLVHTMQIQNPKLFKGP